MTLNLLKRCGTTGGTKSRAKLRPESMGPEPQRPGQACFDIRTTGTSIGIRDFHFTQASQVRSEPEAGCWYRCHAAGTNATLAVSRIECMRASRVAECHAGMPGVKRCLWRSSLAALALMNDCSAHVLLCPMKCLTFTTS